MRRIALVLLVASACGGSSGDGPDGGGGSPDPDFADTAAWVEVGERTYEGGGDTVVIGNLITEAPIWPYDVEPVVGACRYSVRQPMTCADPCDGGVCVGDVCQALPTPRSAGDLTVSAGGETRTIGFGAAGYSFYEPTLVFPPGEALTVSAAGGEIAAFELEADVPATFAVTNRDELVLAIGTPLTVRWEPADPGSRVRLFLGADLGHAQYRSALIECDAPDEAGAIAVPQELVDRLADPALWACGDCFSQSIRRYTRARGTAGSLDVSLLVTQTESLYLVPP
jgi:hypothetical protein